MVFLINMTYKSEETHVSNHGLPTGGGIGIV